MVRWGLGGAVLAAVLGFGFVSGGSADRAARSCGDAQGTLRVMTYNIRTGLGTKNPGKNPLHQLFDKHDVGPIVAAITAADPDVVALQEVLGWGQTERIARALNMDSTFAFHPSPLPWWGNAVISKCPITNTKRVVTSRGKGNGKAMPVAYLDVGGRDVLATSVHRDRDDNTGIQIQKMMAPLAQQNAPVLFMGDFNFKPKDKRYAVVSQAFDDSALMAQSGADYVLGRGTYPVIAGTKKHRRIDYVFLSSGDFTVSDVRVIEGDHAEASDHLGYIADVVLTSGAD
ncbi:endonuclease/exonuclease/phosphatase family protein [Shimia sagamensis]|uniref:Metal-dependent hydrolase, endonuclease/exonuclease/phosphatase family n=1 Tax=Shimia sagamensis TaxID=1566352 RepID=A0ABY1NX84_9RHOB|nr:endonuclease/exonuclease/phosphatase family protein [Shimia sagamensis]SMP20427.1 Metal-dependent hydrolase, endonuclease/exonuclease/phosphatase family [Shimia sagamensis]